MKKIFISLLVVMMVLVPSIIVHAEEECYYDIIIDKMAYDSEFNDLIDIKYEDYSDDSSNFNYSKSIEHSPLKYNSFIDEKKVVDGKLYISYKLTPEIGINYDCSNYENLTVEMNFNDEEDALTFTEDVTADTASEFRTVQLDASVLVYSHFNYFSIKVYDSTKEYNLSGEVLPIGKTHDYYDLSFYYGDNVTYSINSNYDGKWGASYDGDDFYINNVFTVFNKLNYSFTMGIFPDDYDLSISKSLCKELWNDETYEWDLNCEEPQVIDHIQTGETYFENYLDQSFIPDYDTILFTIYTEDRTIFTHTIDVYYDTEREYRDRVEFATLTATDINGDNVKETLTSASPVINYHLEGDNFKPTKYYMVMPRYRTTASINEPKLKDLKYTGQQLNDGIDFTVDYTGLVKSRLWIIVETLDYYKSDYYDPNIEEFYIEDYVGNIKLSDGGFKDLKVNSLNIYTHSYNSLELYFNPMEDAEGYVIYRSTKATSGFKNIANLEGNDSTEYLDTNLTLGTTYYYKVKGYKNEGGVRIYSASPTAKKAVTRVDAPSIDSSSYSYNTVKIEWDRVTKASGYVIYRSSSYDGKYSAIKTITSGKTLSYKNTGLLTGKEYFYKVRAYAIVNGVKKYGSYSYITSASPKLKVPTISGTSGYYRYNRINITKVSGATGYCVYIYNFETGNYDKIGSTTSTVYYDKTTLPYEYNYYIVRAYRKVGTKYKYSDESNEIVLERAADTIELIASTNSYNSNKLTISKLEDASKYLVYRSSSKTGTYTLVKTLYTEDFEGDVITYIDSKLKFNKTYYYKVRAYGRNYSSYTSVVSAKTKLDKPVFTIEDSEQSNTINITAVPYAYAYEIYRSADGINYTKIKATTSLIYVDNIESDVNKYDYVYKIRAYKIINSVKIYGDYSETVIGLRRP